MSAINHIFVYVVRRPEDPFLGLKHLLLQQRYIRHNISEVRLPPASYETVHRVEYSWRKTVRFLYYTSVFRHLENLLCEALNDCKSDNPCVIYFSDEGVWAEFFREFRGRRAQLPIIAVNVQHGFEHHVRIPDRNLRRVVNWLSMKWMGFPAFGMGCFGGVGSGAFEMYLTYDEATSDFIRDNTGDLAFECPSVIKHALFERFKVARQVLSLSCSGQEVMFALQPTIATIFGRTNINGSTLDVFRELTSVAKLLAERHGRRMVFRAHPSMQHDRVMEHYHHSGIERYADIDGHSELGDQLARCSVVMSYDSTVLWEAYILGLVPVSVQGNCYRGGLSFPHEVLDVTSSLEAQLDEVLRPETAKKYRREIVKESFDWESIIWKFIKERPLLGQPHDSFKNRQLRQLSPNTRSDKQLHLPSVSRGST